MLVDDDLDINEQNSLVLKAKGHEISVATTAEQARAMLKKEVPDLIILDVVMETVRAGLEFARDISTEYSVPIVLLTSDMANPDWQAMESETWNSVRSYLKKPVPPAELCKTVEEVLAERKAKKK